MLYPALSIETKRYSTICNLCFNLRMKVGDFILSKELGFHFWVLYWFVLLTHHNWIFFFVAVSICQSFLKVHLSSSIKWLFSRWWTKWSLRGVFLLATHTCCLSKMICFTICKSENFVNFFKYQAENLNNMVVEYFFDVTVEVAYKWWSSWREKLDLGSMCGWERETVKV